MVDQEYFLRAGDSGPEIQGTPGNVLTIVAGGKVQPQPPATPAAPFNVFAGTVTFNHVSGLQRFVVAVPGVAPGSAVWTSLNGEPDTPGEKVSTGGGWASGVDEVTMLADYESGSPVTVLVVPILIFWTNP